jgi:aminopeptidase N
MRLTVPSAAATLILSLLLSPPSNAAPAISTLPSPFSFDTAFGRLPKNVVPLDYDIALIPDVESHTVNGREIIVLHFRAVTDTIVFNSLNETLSDVRFDGHAVESVKSSDEQQLTTVLLKEPAIRGQHTLSFSYTGKMESVGRGMFSQAYSQPDGTKGLLVSTKFEATDARRMFPCWDEPAFRARFRLSVTAPARWVAVSNMPVTQRTTHRDLATTSFDRSPKMPTYLLELSVGDLAKISAERDGVTLNVWAVRGQEQQGTVALANARQILGDYNSYFGYAFPLPKLDSIAIPGGFSGAMENWGAITYTDQILLLNSSSTMANEQAVFSTQAHEMAHQWNGDLVTMGWWDDIWLNESFASWRAAKETDERHPEWRWWEKEDASKENAMAADARINSHAIQVHIADELLVVNAFDSEIAYDKGQSLVHMLEAYLGPEVFRDGVRRFMKAHAFSNATTTDLWNALSAASGHDLASVAGSWVGQAGFPLVSVAASCDAEGHRSLNLTQKRFLLRGVDADGALWSIPLRIRSGLLEEVHTQLMSDAALTVAAGSCDEPLTLDAGNVGFFRVAYDEPTLKVNTRDFAALPDSDRIALLDDQWALVEADQQQLGSYLHLVAQMGSDLNTRAWTQIVGALNTVHETLRGSPDLAAFDAFACKLLRPTADQLGWESGAQELPDRQELRRTIIAALGTFGDEGVLTGARQRFAAFLADHSAVHPDEQMLILSIVAKHADAATFEQLHTLAKSAKTDTEMRRDYFAMMETEDPALATQAASIAMSGEIPPQAAVLRFFMLLTLANDHPKLAWEVVSAHVDELIAPQGRYAPTTLARSVPAAFWDALPPEELETWLTAHVPAALAANITRAMETVAFRRSEKASLAAAASAYVHSLPPVSGG